jgi:hypothetical protein
MSGIRESTPDGTIPPYEAPDDIEARARRAGWMPKDEFRGDPARWTSAEEYLRIVEERLPVLLERNRKLDRRVEELDRNLREVLQVATDMRQSATRNEQRAYERARAELLESQRAAVASADTATYERTSAQLEVLEKEKPVAPTPPAAPKVEVPAEVQAFVSRSPWFQRNESARALAVAEHERLLRVSPDMAMSANLAQVEERVRRAFPEEFPAPVAAQQQEPSNRRDQPAAVGYGNGAPSARSNGAPKRIADLPISPAEKAEARRALERWQRQMKDFTEEEYVRNYSS